MVECTALEMRHTREGIQGSNPCLSATFHLYGDLGRTPPNAGERIKAAFSATYYTEATSLRS